MQLRRINTGLLVAIILVNGYLILLPVLPIISFWAQKHIYKAGAGLQQKINLPLSKVSSTGNRLIIPSILLDQPVVDGPDMRALDKGTWRRPNTSTPDKGSNTVIVGHRFTYTNPRGSFYHLDTVKPGDQIGLFWQSQRYVYIVDSIRTVKADEVSVEAPTKKPTLTLYTCTPLWLPKDRLVITASITKEQPYE